MKALLLLMFLACPSSKSMVCPDPSLTPGVVNPLLSQAVICDPQFRTWRYRKLYYAEEKQVCLAYHLNDCPGPLYEMDHLIAIYDGGSNEIGNIWPQPIAQARIKDILERWVHRQICTGKMSLPQGQALLSHDWPATTLLLLIE